MMYHKLSLELTGYDGRAWTLDLEPGHKSDEWFVSIQYEPVGEGRALTCEECAAIKAKHPPLKYQFRNTIGMLQALSEAITLVPCHQGGSGYVVHHEVVE